MGQGGLGEVEMLSPLRVASKFSPNFYLAETRDFNALEIEKSGICFLHIDFGAPEEGGDSQGNIDLDFQKGFVGSPLPCSP
jgi:hypothetical protein